MGAISVAVIAAVGLAVGIGIGLAVSSFDPGAPAPQAPQTAGYEGAAELHETVDVGILLPLTGRQSTHGTENTAGAMLAISDFNDHLELLGADWRLHGISEDTATSPVVATEKLAVFNARGIQLIIGPETSAEIRAVKGYADSNGMLMISPSSTAPSLAIPDDSVYRMVTDDSKQGPGVAALARYLDKDILIPVWRGDAWGDGLSKTASESFAARGGIVDDGIRYSPEIAEFSATMSLLADKVESYTESADPDSIAVLLISFTEAVQIVQSASNYDSLAGVSWLGTAANAKEHKLVEDPVASEFSGSVGFTTIQIAATHNDIYEDVHKRLGAQFGGREPNGYAFTSYDATWALATAILHTGTTDVAALKEALREVAAHNFGAIGTTRLNEAGDLELTNYDLWSISGGEWGHIGQYLLETDKVIISDAGARTA